MDKHVAITKNTVHNGYDFPCPLIPNLRTAGATGVVFPRALRHTSYPSNRIFLHTYPCLPVKMNLKPFAQKLCDSISFFNVPPTKFWAQTTMKSSPPKTRHSAQCVVCTLCIVHRTLHIVHMRCMVHGIFRGLHTVPYILSMLPTVHSTLCTRTLRTLRTVNLSLVKGEHLNHHLQWYLMKKQLAIGGARPAGTGPEGCQNTLPCTLNHVTTVPGTVPVPNIQPVRMFAVRPRVTVRVTKLAGTEKRRNSFFWPCTECAACSVDDLKIFCVLRLVAFSMAVCAFAVSGGNEEHFFLPK